MKKFLTVLLVIAVMFTFSFGSAFAAVTGQTGTYEKNETKDQLLNNTAFVKQTGEYGITEAYRDALVKDWNRVAGDYGTISGAVTQADAGYKINSTNYYTAEKAEAKELVNAAIESFKAATTAKDAKTAEDKLVAKLSKLVKSAIDTKMRTDLSPATAANYLDTLDVALGSVLSVSAKDHYLLPGYGYIDEANLDVPTKTVADLDAAVAKTAITGVTTEEDLIEYWFIDNGYRTLADAKAHLAEFKAALVPLTAAEVTKIQAEFDAIDAKAKAAKDAFTLGGGYAVSTVDGVDLDALEAIYAEEKAYEEKYAATAGSTLTVGANTLYRAWTSFKGTNSTEEFLAYVYGNQYASEIKAVDLTSEDAVVALVDKIDDLQYVYDYITIPAPAASKEYTALTKAYNNFKKAAEDALTAAGSFEWISGTDAKAYFNDSEKNVKALEANRAAYDKLVKTYGSSCYDDALEAKILAGEHNKAAAAGYDEKADKIDTSKVQAYLNNATVKVTTKALGSKKVRVNAAIDATSFNYILGEMTDGCTVSYQFYYKKAANTTYKAGKVKDVNYTTFKLVKGTKYNFQCQVVIKDADGKVVATKDYKASTVGTRTVK